MKTNLIKAFSLMVLIACFGKLKAQNDLLSDNTSYAPSSVASLYKSDDKITVSEFMPNQTINSSQVNVKCTTPLTVQVKVFRMDGNMAKQESHTLDVGVSELNINMNDLAAGMYMVQFYSKEGSAVRRFTKVN